MSCGDTSGMLSNQVSFYNPHQVCPTCGRCPTCGGYGWGGSPRITYTYPQTTITTAPYNQEKVEYYKEWLGEVYGNSSEPPTNETGSAGISPHASVGHAID